MNEIAALGGYAISGTDTQSVSNKSRALRRLNTIKAHIIGRFGGHWDRNWREGYLGITALYSTGTAVFTNGSQTVTGVGTAWTSAMVGSTILAGSELYRIASVASGTTLYISTPFNGTTSASAGISYQIWQDRYRLYPDVLGVDDFINFIDPAQMSETWKAALRNSFPASTQSGTNNAQIPRLWSNVGMVGLTSSYSAGTVTGSANSNVLTGSGTSWLANLEPGWDITLTIAGKTYNNFRVKSVDSDSQITLYQMLPSAISGITYTAIGKNCPRVQFPMPASQQLLSYGYYSKDWPFINDNDSDWVAELYPQVMEMGATYMDFLDKSDTVRSREARTIFENAISDIHVAEHMNYTGVRTIGYNIPGEARDL